MLTGTGSTAANVTPTMQSLGIDKLTRDQRIVLAQQIWDSIAAESPPHQLTTAQEEELERRMADLEANPNDGVPWEEVLAKALARNKQ